MRFGCYAVVDKEIGIFVQTDISLPHGPVCLRGNADLELRTGCQIVISAFLLSLATLQRREEEHKFRERVWASTTLGKSLSDFQEGQRNACREARENVLIFCGRRNPRRVHFESRHTCARLPFPPSNPRNSRGNTYTYIYTRIMYTHIDTRAPSISKYAGRMSF